MPDPEPLPPQPRPVSVVRWLLMLLPSVPIIVPSLIVDALRPSLIEPLPSEWASEARINSLIWMEFLRFAVSVVLSFFLAFHLEKWRFGNCRDWQAAIAWGFGILCVNFVISFAGCAAIAVTTPTHHP